MWFETDFIMALQGHPRSLILAPIKRAYATSCWSSIVTLVVSCPVSEILQVFCWEERPHPYFTRIFGVIPLDFADVVAPRSEDSKLITRVITFELVLPICPRYVNVTDRHTDGRTTYDSNTALAIRALRGKTPNIICDQPQRSLMCKRWKLQQLTFGDGTV